MSKYDYVLYINLTQDLLLSRMDTLIIHGRKMDLVNIPDRSHLDAVTDKHLDPQHITPFSKLYFSAHGGAELNSGVFNRRSGDAKLYKTEEIADFIAKLLIKDDYKNPQFESRLTLVLSVCVGLNFAKNLQQRLLDKHGLYIDVIANKLMTHERYTMMPSGPSDTLLGKRQYKKPYSKVLITLDKDGKQMEIDAHELQWIEQVHQHLHKKLSDFLKRADIANPVNKTILRDIQLLCQHVDRIIQFHLHNNVSKTANLLLALLIHCTKDSQPFYKGAMKYLALRLDMNDLIRHGVTYINLEGDIQHALNDIEEYKAKQDEPLDIEETQHLIQLAKATFSHLLAEVIDEEEIQPFLMEAEKIANELKPEQPFITRRLSK